MSISLFKNMTINLNSKLLALSFLFLCSCNMHLRDPYPGPDKQGQGLIYGAMMGAGSGAVTGFQTSAGAGPGALAGMGFGAIFGMFSGLGLDINEEGALENNKQLKELRETIWAQEMLAEHYSRRLELHPSRDIFPADWFFAGDGVQLTCRGEILVKEIARLNKSRMPWSRLMIAVYSVASNPQSSYSEHLTRRRGEEIALVMVREGVEPRRIMTKQMTIPNALLIDPYDNANRYKQAIEIVALDY
ncbi:MAG: hypothetical protein IT292_11380 [Deltaproteobacteria bacterium]|nr:hypothetical protein [Deltaproteobacteria bacterium]